MIRFLFWVTLAVLYCVPTVQAGVIEHWGIFGGLTLPTILSMATICLKISKTQNRPHRRVFAEWLTIRIIH